MKYAGGNISAVFQASGTGTFNGAFAFTALIHGHRSIIGHLEERNDALAFAVGALDVAAGRADTGPVVAQPAGPLGQRRVVADALEDVAQVVVDGCEVAG